DLHVGAHPLEADASAASSVVEHVDGEPLYFPVRLEEVIGRCVVGTDAVHTGADGGALRLDAHCLDCGEHKCECGYGDEGLPNGVLHTVMPYCSCRPVLRVLDLRRAAANSGTGYAITLFGLFGTGLGGGSGNALVVGRQ